MECIIKERSKLYIQVFLKIETSFFKTHRTEYKSLTKLYYGIIQHSYILFASFSTKMYTFLLLFYYGPRQLSFDYEFTFFLI